MIEDAAREHWEQEIQTSGFSAASEWIECKDFRKGELLYLNDQVTKSLEVDSRWFCEAIEQP